MSTNSLRLSLPASCATVKPAHASRSTRAAHSLALTPRDIVAATSTDGRNARRVRSRSGSCSTTASQLDTMSDNMSCFDDADVAGPSVPTSVATTVDDAKDYISSKAAGLSRKTMHRSPRERVASAPNLHINTFLPLVLPPQDAVKRASSAASSPMPSAWQEGNGKRLGNSYGINTARLSVPDLPSLSIASATPPAMPIVAASNVQALDLQRSDSLASFASSAIDGSWHGDEGDDDPDGQLERAVKDTQQTCTVDDKAFKSKFDALSLITRDYDADVDDWSFDYPQSEMDGSMDHDEDSIRLHAGPLMHTFASILFDGVALSGIETFKAKHRFTASNLDVREDCPRRQSLVSSMTSPSDLTKEMHGLRARSRSGSVTQGTDATLWNKLWTSVYSSASTMTAAGGAALGSSIA